MKRFGALVVLTVALAGCQSSEPQRAESSAATVTEPAERPPSESETPPEAPARSRPSTDSSSTHSSSLVPPIT